MLKKYLILIMIIYAASTAVSFGNDFGTTGGQILSLYTSARYMAMGNAGVGLAGDASAVEYNPAGLARMDKKQCQFSHIFYFVGTKMNSITAGGNLGKIGLGMKWKIFYTKDTIRNIKGGEEEGFDIRYMQYSVGIGYPLTRKHSIGLTLNGITEEIYEDKGEAYSLDLGWHYQFNIPRKYQPVFEHRAKRHKYFTYIIPAKVNSVGVVVKNIGTKLETCDGSEYDLPLRIAAGGAHEIPIFIKKLMLLWEVYNEDQIDFAYKCGIEAEINRFLARAGVMQTEESRLTFGIGLPEKNWYLDYAVFIHRDLGLAHRFSYGVCFK